VLGYASADVNNGYIYEIGGINTGTTVTTTINYASLNSNGVIGSWQATTPAPYPLDLNEVIAYNGYLYSVGGDNINTGVYGTSTVEYAPLNSNGTVGTWQATNPLPVTAYNHGTVAYNGYLYAISGTQNLAASASVYYAPISASGTVGSWQTTTAIPTYESNAGYHFDFAYDNYLYVAGGITSGGNMTSSIMEAPINSNGTVGAWQLASALPSVLYSESTAIYNGYLFVSGGIYSTSSPGDYGTSTVWMASINASGTIGTWQQEPSLPTIYYGHPMVTSNGYLYILGGFANGNQSTSTLSAAITCH
jgi:hypothetical protein